MVWETYLVPTTESKFSIVELARNETGFAFVIRKTTHVDLGTSEEDV